MKMYDTVQIEPYLENKSYQSMWGGPKTLFGPNPDPKIGPIGPKMTQELVEN